MRVPRIFFHIRHPCRFHLQSGCHFETIIFGYDAGLHRHLNLRLFGYRQGPNGCGIFAITDAFIIFKCDWYRSDGVIHSHHKIDLSIEGGYVKSLGVTKAEVALALDRAAQLVTPENKGNLYRLAMLDEHAIVRQPVQQRHRKLLRLVNRHLVPKRVIHPVDLLILLPIAKDVLLHLLQVAVMRPRPVGPHLSRYLARRYLHVGLLSNRVCHAPPLSIA